MADGAKDDRDSDGMVLIESGPFAGLQMPVVMEYYGEEQTVQHEGYDDVVTQASTATITFEGADDSAGLEISVEGWAGHHQVRAIVEWLKSMAKPIA